MQEDKVYFKPGDCVILRLHELMHSPVMLVLRKETALFKDDQPLKGIRCRWFTKNDELQESIFSTKDLQLIDDGRK